MKKIFMTAAIFVLTILVLAGCSSLAEAPATTRVTEPAPTTEATEATTVATEATVPATTEEEIYEGDAFTHYIKDVYTRQIDRYQTALSQKWDEAACLENKVSMLLPPYYEGSAAENVGFSFMDLDGDGIWELIISAILNADRHPLVFEIWTLRNDTPVMVAQSGSHNRYYLQYAKDDDLWSVAYEAENGAANFALYDLQLSEGQFTVVQGVIFDAAANESQPWFMTYDLDWDVSNDTPIDEQTAVAVQDSIQKRYTSVENFPYSLYAAN